jgi:hypothetical protein
MPKTEKNFNLSFESLKLSDTLKKKLPAWYHIGVNHQVPSKLNITAASKCLRRQHKIQTIGDLVLNIKHTKDTTTQTP